MYMFKLKETRRTDYCGEMVRQSVEAKAGHKTWTKKNYTKTLLMDKISKKYTILKLNTKETKIKTW